MINKKRNRCDAACRGQGSRLFALTQKKAKPAVSYGGKYKIIDFPLSNCTNSGIDTVGVLTQYEPLELNAYIGTGGFWDLDQLKRRCLCFTSIYEGEKQVTGTVEQQMRFIRTSISLIILIQIISLYYLVTRSVPWIMTRCFSIIKKKVQIVRSQF